MTAIRKVVITKFGDESVLAIADGDVPDPAPKQVQLAVEYSVVSGSDVNMRRGTYPLQRKAPLTPGYSVLGTVRLNGKGGSRFKIGDRVACPSKYDGQAELINLPERYLVRVPDGVDPEAAVALVLDWVTAYEMLHRAAHVQTGQRVFLHGLSGGVGTALLTLAKLAGAEVYGTAAASKHDELRKFGAVPFDYKSKDWIRAMQQSGGVDAVFDALGYESFDESYSILRKGGKLVAYGLNLPALTHTKKGSPLLVVLKLVARNLQFWSGKRTTFFGLNRRSKHFNPDLELLFSWLAQGRINVPIKATFTLDQIQQAHREYASSTGRGSIILKIRG